MSTNNNNYNNKAMVNINAWVSSVQPGAPQEHKSNVDNNNGLAPAEGPAEEVGTNVVVNVDNNDNNTHLATAHAGYHLVASQGKRRKHYSFRLGQRRRLFKSAQAAPGEVVPQAVWRLICELRDGLAGPNGFRAQSPATRVAERSAARFFGRDPTTANLVDVVFRHVGANGAHLQSYKVRRSWLIRHLPNLAVMTEGPKPANIVILNVQGAQLTAAVMEFIAVFRTLRSGHLAIVALFVLQLQPHPEADLMGHPLFNTLAMRFGQIRIELGADREKKLHFFNMVLLAMLLGHHEEARVYYTDRLKKFMASTPGSFKLVRGEWTAPSLVVPLGTCHGSPSSQSLASFLVESIERALRELNSHQPRRFCHERPALVDVPCYLGHRAALLEELTYLGFTAEDNLNLWYTGRCSDHVAAILRDASQTIGIIKGCISLSEAEERHIMKHIRTHNDCS
ncbi:hypothetical protein BJ508DRAFT_330600 [Ascobolus immersus RN42]|uniref:Uncharacterized protein n=1 Tax=Ascobolus immersus RN42 TaxID=1160509 RepID=A0A3N4HTP1_ASCIM|nr:hypothetical protein BJ508DRAFT_330600 [Ascobolus immersus RN42]